MNKVQHQEWKAIGKAADRIFALLVGLRSGELPVSENVESVLWSKCLQKALKIREPRLAPPPAVFINEAQHLPGASEDEPTPEK